MRALARNPKKLEDIKARAKKFIFVSVINQHIYKGLDIVEAVTSRDREWSLGGPDILTANQMADFTPLQLLW